MAVPKKRQTKSSRNRRRSHHSLKKVNFAVCPKCKEPVLAHHFCQACGTYNGREVIDVMAKLSKKERKAREKEMDKAGEKADKEAKKSKPLNLEKLSKK